MCEGKEMMNRSLLILASALVAGAANAKLLCQTVNLGPCTTDWTKSAKVNKFDTKLGKLTGVTITVTENVCGTLKLENLQCYDRNVNGSIGGTVTVKLPNGSVALSTSASKSTSVALKKYDGCLDYAGKSGKTIANLCATSTKSVTLTAANIVSQFIGSGSAVLPVLATGTYSPKSKSGDISVKALIDAGAQIQVCYDYAPVPEPTSMAVLGLGCVALIRRRRAK